MKDEVKNTLRAIRGGGFAGWHESGVSGSARSKRSYTGDRGWNPLLQKTPRITVHMRNKDKE